VPVAVAVAPAVTVTMADARPADYGAGRAACNRADRTGDHRAGCSADCGAGYGSFSAACCIGRSGQGSERRETCGDKKFAHRILRSSIAGKRVNARKVHLVNELFRLTGRNAHRSNCDL
jgi:hypothetical protein